MQISSQSGVRPLQQALLTLGLLGLAGVASRIPVIAMPPVVPLLHDDLHLSETEVGALVGLPLALFALAAVPGSLLVARLGARTTLIAGLAIAAISSALRGAAGNVWMLYAATIVMGGGISIMQPAMPRLVREWLPDRIGLGTAAYTNGMVIGATTAVALTPFMLGLLGGNWRFDLVAWASVVLAVTLLIWLAAPAEHKSRVATVAVSWWPNWRSPLPWILGFAFAGNNSIYFALHALLPDFLSSVGRGSAVSHALLWLNLASLAGIFVLLLAAEHLLHRAWPYVVFGALMFCGVVGLVVGSPDWLALYAFLVGVSSSITLGTLMALPTLLSPPDEVHLTAAGMFTVAYTCALIVPVISGAAWDLTGIPQFAFVPIALCAVALIVFGVIATRLPAYRPPPVAVRSHHG